MQTYIIQKGDTLDKIINKFVISYKELKRLNPNVDFTKLKVGMKICLKKDVAAIYYEDSNEIL